MKQVMSKLLLLVPIILACILSYELGRQAVTNHILAYLIIIGFALLAWLGAVTMVKWED